MVRIMVLMGLVVSSAVKGDVETRGTSWMTGLDGRLSLSQLSIPGTHDSGARLEPVPGTARCQSLSIRSQLDAGVRFLDVRCRHVDDRFRVHHGVVDQKIGFAEVVGDVLDFLDSYPGETVIMSVKPEHRAVGATRSFEATLDSYIAGHADRWWLAEELPRLDQVRGKVVLFRRFGAESTPKGIDASKWPDNTTFSQGKTLRVQDRYVVQQIDDKWNSIEEILNEAKTGGSNTFFVNFTSGYRSGLLGMPDIPAVSRAVHPRLKRYFADHPTGRFGIVLMDFVDAELAALVYRTNPVREDAAKSSR